jgi:hypothetical protein
MRLFALSGRRREALQQYEWLEDVLSAELGAEPEAITQHLRKEIEIGQFLPPRQPPSPDAPPAETSGSGMHNLPAARTSFAGREMMEAKRELAMTPLLPLMGAGGSGKARLALEVARSLICAYPEGVWLVELAPLTEGELVLRQAIQAGFSADAVPPTLPLR